MPSIRPRVAIDEERLAVGHVVKDDVVDPHPVRARLRGQRCCRERVRLELRCGAVAPTRDNQRECGDQAGGVVSGVTSAGS
jgi:hypothetical protein